VGAANMNEGGKRTFLENCSEEAEKTLIRGTELRETG